MKIDVLIEYDEKLSEVNFSSKATQIKEKRPATIGLSHPTHKSFEVEFVEFVGHDRKDVEIIRDEFNKEPTRKDHVLRVINPFEPATFEPYALFCMVDFFSIYVLHTFYPRTFSWRREIPLLNPFEITLKIPGYKFLDPQKKAEFEKLLRKKYKRVSFIS
jgi:hypothetical protein